MAIDLQSADDKNGDETRVPHFARWLLLITILGFCLRLVVIITSKGEAVGGDGFAYSIVANRNAAGHWFLSPYTGKPDAIHPPAWTLVLTLWAKLGFHEVFQQQVLASVIGTSSIALVGLAARRIAGERVALVAATIAAIYAGLWLYERALLSETLLFPVVALMVLASYTFHRNPTWPGAALLGAIAGLIALIRAEQILIVAVLVLPLILSARSISTWSRVRWSLLSLGLTLVVVAPWTIYNLGRFQHPIFLSTQAGAAVETGNCGVTYHGPLIGFYSLACLRSTGPDNKPISDDESVADGQVLHIGLSYEEHHLGQLPLVVIAREGRTFGYWNPFQQTMLDNAWQTLSPIFGKSTSVWVYDLALVSYWVLLVPAIVGGIVLRRRRIPLYPLLAFFATVIVTVSYNFGETRYRAAADVPLVILAAVGIEAGLRWLARSNVWPGHRNYLMAKSEPG